MSNCPQAHSSTFEIHYYCLRSTAMPHQFNEFHKLFNTHRVWQGWFKTSNSTATSFFNIPTDRSGLHVASFSVAKRMVNILERKYHISVVYRILWVGLCGFVLPTKMHIQNFASLKASLHNFPSHSHIEENASAQVPT